MSEGRRHSLMGGIAGMTIVAIYFPAVAVFFVSQFILSSIQSWFIASPLSVVPTVGSAAIGGIAAGFWTFRLISVFVD